VDIGKTPTDTHKFLKQSEKHSKVSRSLIFKWHKRFADGRDSLADDEREGRPSFRESDAVKNEVRDVINGDRRLTVREVADKCGLQIQISQPFRNFDFSNLAGVTSRVLSTSLV
jgi:hypothetical protein